MVGQHFLSLRNTAKHGNIPIDKLIKTKCRYKSYRRNHSTKLRLMQKYEYVNAYTFVFISLNH